MNSEKMPIFWQTSNLFFGKSFKLEKSQPNMKKIQYDKMTLCVRLLQSFCPYENFLVCAKQDFISVSGYF